MPFYFHPIPAHTNKVVMFSFFLIIASVLSVNAQSGADTAITKSKAAKWFKKKEWLNGAPLKPHKSINRQELARQYRINKAYWDKAFAFLKEQNLQTIAKGKYPID